jgi:type III secretion protein L
MSKKLFSLIHGETVRLAPKTKVISSDVFSVALDAGEVLSKVKEDAEKYRLGVTKEIELLKEQAQKEGYEAGFKEWADHVAKLEEEIINVRGELEKFLVPVALKAAKKIVGREIELSEDTIVDIVSTSLKGPRTLRKKSQQAETTF